MPGLFISSKNRTKLVTLKFGENHIKFTYKHTQTEHTHIRRLITYIYNPRLFYFRYSYSNAPEEFEKCNRWILERRPNCIQL